MAATTHEATPETELVIHYVTTGSDVHDDINEALERLHAHADQPDQVDTGVWTPAEAAEMILAEKLQSILANTPCSDLTPAVHSDLLDLALSRVNWHQVAAALL